VRAYGRAALTPHPRPFSQEKGEYLLILEIFPGSQTKHLNEATRHLAQRFAFAPAIVHRGVTHAPAEKRTKRSETLKAYFKADVGDAGSGRSQKLFGPFDAALNQILMWRGFELVAKQPEKVIARQASLFGNLSQIQRLVVRFVDEPARARKPLLKIGLGDSLSLEFSRHRRQTPVFVGEILQRVCGKRKRLIRRLRRLHRLHR
jgi:hypothetical protein